MRTFGVLSGSRPDLDRFFVARDPQGQPLWLLKWPAESNAVEVWSHSRGNWFPAWANALDEVHDLTREHDTQPLTAEKAEGIEPEVDDPSDDVLTHWAASQPTPRGDRWGNAR